MVNLDPRPARRFTGLAALLQRLQGDAIALGVMLLDRRQESEVAGGFAEDAACSLDSAICSSNSAVAEASRSVRAWAANSGYMVVYS